MKVKSLSRVRLFATSWTVAYQAPPSVGFSRQEYWSGLPFPSPGDLPNPGIEPGSPALQADALPSEPPGKTQKYGTEIKEGLYSWMGRQYFKNGNISQMVYMLNAIFNKPPASFLHNGQVDPEMRMEMQGNKKSQNKFESEQR